jgi:phosphoglycerate-specific signal transduction histidine kinase
MTFRLKLTTIVGATALAFLLLIVTGALTANRVDQQLATIQDRYLPKVELRPRLEKLFDGIRRGLQDSVAARDLDALAGTGALVSRFLDELAAARDALDPAQASALRSAMEAD